jgi:peptidyl-prolyl cis-trans isomerase B (cyclophilin B)
VASTKDRQRALERARYERVQAKIAKQQAAARRRRRVAIFTAIVVVAVGGGSLAAVLATSSSPKTTPTANGSASASASAAPSASASASAAAKVGYTKSGTAAKNVGVPTYDAAAAAKPYTATIHTNRGDVVFTALTTKAPYTTFSFEFLAGKNYFNNTKCHRLVTSGIFVLQCGDPSGTGSGGPGYQFQDENLGYFGTGTSVTYKAGTVAMANSGAGTNGSQFFLVYKDSPLAPSYTPFGTITKGMDVLQAIAAQGNGPTDATTGNTPPKQTVTITSVTVSQS